MRGWQVRVPPADVGLHQIDPHDLFVAFGDRLGVILKDVEIGHDAYSLFFAVSISEIFDIDTVVPRAVHPAIGFVQLIRFAGVLNHTHRLLTVVDHAAMVLVFEDIHLARHTGRTAAAASTRRTTAAATLHRPLSHLLRHLVLLHVTHLRLIHNVLLSRR